MGFLFDSKKEESTSGIDPWETMPDWMKEAYEKDADFRQTLLDQGVDIQGQLDKNPRKVLGPSKNEYKGLNEFLTGIDKANSLGYQGEKATKASMGLDEEYLDPAKRYVGQSNDLGDSAKWQMTPAIRSVKDTQDILDATSGKSGLALTAAKDRTASDAALEAAGFDIDALRAKYETGYTDDVVDTTLAGMDRSAERDRRAREGENAAIGGTSNTRQAVADAVAGQLTGMNRAQMEATLRDQGYTRAIEGAHGEAGLDLSRGDLYNTLSNTELARSGMLDKLVQTDLDKAGVQRGITSDRMDIGEFFRGLSSDELDRAGVLNSLAGTNLDINSTVAQLYDQLAGSRAARGAMAGGALGGMGELERSLKQEGMDEARTNKQQNLGWLADLFSGTQYEKGPVGQSQTQTTQKPSLFSQILGAGASGLGAFLASDERVKEDIEPLPLDTALAAIRELNPSAYRYREGFGHTTERTSGVMAQDVERAGIPGGVKEIDGVKHVDLYPLLATAIAGIKELDKRTS